MRASNLAAAAEAQVARVTLDGAEVGVGAVWTGAATALRSW